jgi:xanthine/CO dehydrogenase XdhC/CoxF family maturation factor
MSRNRLARRLLLVANLTAANVAAAVVVIGFLRPGFVGIDAGPAGAAFGGRVLIAPLETGAAWTAFLAAAALLVLNFTWLVRRPEHVEPANWIVSDTPSGPVRIAREALEAGLRLAGEALPEVTRVRVQVDTRAQKRILVNGQFHCAEGTNNLAASQRLRQAMLDRFGEMVRPADGGRVELVLEFQGFAGKLGKKAGDVPPPEDVPFTGPKYPIDDEGPGGAT